MQLVVISNIRNLLLQSFLETFSQNDLIVNFNNVLQEGSNQFQINLM